MELRFYHDPESGLPHIYDYGVTEREVEWILARPNEDGPSSRDSRQAMGLTENGRCLRVIYVPDEEVDGIFVITAYPVTGKQEKAFRRRQRRKRR